jgi:hypothetical protein
MKRRREHIECETREGGRGCIVLGTPVCQVKKNKQTPWELMKRGLWSSMAFDNAILCFILVIAVAIGMRMIRIVTDSGARLAPEHPNQVLPFRSFK